MTGREMSERRWGSGSPRPPKATAAQKRGVIRLDLSVLQNPRVEKLSDAEWRAYVTLLPWVARFADDDGEVPQSWLRETFAFGQTPSGRPRRLTPKLLQRLASSGLVEAWEYDDGERTIALVGWRDFRPIDMTSAERKRRFRRRLYGALYYGTEGEVVEVRLPEESPDEVAAIEAEGRALMAEVERRGLAAVLGESAVDTHP